MFQDIIIDNISTLKSAINLPIEIGVPSGKNALSGFNGKENEDLYIQEFKEIFNIYLNRHLNFTSSKKLKRRSNMNYFSYLFSDKEELPFIFTRRCFEGFEYDGENDFETLNLGLNGILKEYLKGKCSVIYIFRCIFNAVIKSLYLNRKGLALETDKKLKKIPFIEPWLSTWKFVSLVIKSISRSIKYIAKNKIFQVSYIQDGTIEEVFDSLCEIDSDFLSIPLNENVRNRKEAFYLYLTKNKIDSETEKIELIHRIYKKGRISNKDIIDIDSSIRTMLNDTTTLLYRLNIFIDEENGDKISKYNKQRDFAWIINTLLQLILDMISFKTDEETKLDNLNQFENSLSLVSYYCEDASAFLSDIRRDLFNYKIFFMTSKRKGPLFRLCHKFINEHVMRLSYLFFQTNLHDILSVENGILYDLKYLHETKYCHYLYDKMAQQFVNKHRRNIGKFKRRYRILQERTSLKIYDINYDNVINRDINPELWGVIVNRAVNIFSGPFITDRMFEIIRLFFTEPSRLSYKQSIGYFVMDYILKYCSYYNKRYIISDRSGIVLFNGSSLALGVCSFFQMLDYERLVYWREAEPSFMISSPIETFEIINPVKWLSRQMESDGDENPFTPFRIKSMFVGDSYEFTRHYFGYFDNIGLKPLLDALYDEGYISKMLRMYISGYKGLTEQKVTRYIAESYRAKMHQLFYNGEKLTVDDSLINERNLLKAKVLVIGRSDTMKMELGDVIDTILSRLSYAIFNETEETTNDETDLSSSTRSVIEGGTSLLDSSIMEFSILAGGTIKPDKLTLKKSTSTIPIESSYDWEFSPESEEDIIPLNKLDQSKGFIVNKYLGSYSRNSYSWLLNKSNFKGRYILLCDVYPLITNFRYEKILADKVCYKSYKRFVNLSMLRANLQFNLRQIRKEIKDISEKFLLLRESLLEKEANNYLNRTEIPKENKKFKQDLPRYIEYIFDRWGLS